MDGQKGGTRMHDSEILRQLPTPIMTVDKDFNVTFMNDFGCAFLGEPEHKLVGQKCYDLFQTPHCNTPECRMRQAMETGANMLTRNETSAVGRTVPFVYSAAPLRDEQGEIIGGVEYIIDITEQVQYEQEVERLIAEMSTPVVRIADGVLLVPVIGSLDTARSQQMTASVLDAIAREDAKVTILDVTGLPTFDTSVARHILTTVAAARVLGSEMIITGFSPDAAQTLAQLGVDFSALRTRGSLKAGIAEALSMLNGRRG